MLLVLAATSWLLLTEFTGVVKPKPLISDNRITRNRQAYWEHAQKHGMCKKSKDLNRELVVPPNGVLADFNICVAKNEFQEEVNDDSGDIFCQGLAIHLMADALGHQEDNKDFVDRASNLSGAAFNKIFTPLTRNLTVRKFLEATTENNVLELHKPGEELRLYNNSRAPNTPDFVYGIRPQARIFQAWGKIVHHYWNMLDRTMIQMSNDYLIPGPGSNPHHKSSSSYSTTLIRLEHPFVIAGGRFREQYYWDSFFIMEGLIAARMSYLARTTLLNFMDQIKAYGFIPNGGRKYYLNRSQPPLFIHMLYIYVENTEDYQILHEALPLAERELRWWYLHRNATVSHKGKTHTVFLYNVTATGPRPESYAEDWTSVWCRSQEAPSQDFEQQRYSEFASGAETGWDYTARWMNTPYAQRGRNRLDQMRDLRVRRTIPVDLNSIMYRCHLLMASLYQIAFGNESPYADRYSQNHQAKADRLRDAILNLHWDPDNLQFFDFILDEDKSRSRTVHNGMRSRFWSGASVVPYWAHIWPKELNCSTSEGRKNTALAFSGLRDMLERYPGPVPATLIRTGQQWDFPNAWPPLQYFVIESLRQIDSQCVGGITTDDFKKVSRPRYNLGLYPLPDRIRDTPPIDYSTSPSWRDVLLKTVVMRYMNAAFCNWNKEGKLPEDRVEHILKDDPKKDKFLSEHPGNMYEKFNAEAPDEAGKGGEYTVQTGFGWTNGVVIWIAKHFGAILDNPKCPEPAKSSVAEVDDLLMFQDGSS